MPIQNVGTLIENLVVAETAALLLDRLEPGRSLGFVNAFAMPPLSEWRPHTQSVGFSSLALQQVAESQGGSDFVDAMRRSLRYHSDRGPNGVLLVCALATLRGTAVNVWANDIPSGHYGSVVEALEGIAEVVREILPGSAADLRCETCPVPYPESLEHLQTVLPKWQDVGASFGFLDPMRYVLDQRAGPYTHPPDHRRWLRTLHESSASVALHFTGNNDWASLCDELAGIRDDLQVSGFPYALEVSRQHYVVSVGTWERSLLSALSSRIESSWADWCDRVPEIKTRRLKLRRFEAGALSTGRTNPSSR